SDNSDFQSANNERQTGFGDHKKLNLKPSDDFIKDLNEDKKTADATKGNTNIVLTKQQIERNSNVYMNASRGVISTAPKIEPKPEYRPSKKKISGRASSLRLYSIVVLIISFI